MARYVGKKGEFRFYAVSGAANSVVNYFTMLFSNMDAEFPMGRARPEETVVMNRGKLDSFYHYVLGDDRIIVDPLTMTFSCEIDNTTNRQKLRDFINADAAVDTAWIVGSTNLNTTKALSTHTKLRPGLDTAAGAGIATVAFDDIRKMTCDAEILFDQGASDIGQRFEECYFPPAQQRIREEAARVAVSMTAMIYGHISEITSFTSGTAL